MQWWLRQGLFVWFLLTLVWGALTILWDAVVLAVSGVRFTISWQAQVASKDNPVIACAMTFVCWGLMWHFFRLRNVPLFDFENQLVWKAIAAGLLAITFVELCWTQRGPGP